MLISSFVLLLFPHMTSSSQVLTLKDLKKGLILSLQFVGDNSQKEKQKKCDAETAYNFTITHFFDY